MSPKKTDTSATMVDNKRKAYNHLMKILDQGGMNKRIFATYLDNLGFNYNVNSIENWMSRGLPKKPGLLHAITHILVDNIASKHHCTTTDIVTFLVLAGIQLNEIQTIATLFPPDEFKEALLRYLPDLSYTPNDGPFPCNIPIQRTSFIGRQHEQQQIKALLSNSPLLTLWGTGGCGKTRLALHIAHELHTTFRHGTCFVDLSIIRDPTLVPAEIARVLKLSTTEGKTLLESLKDYLRNRHGLMILDNFEHVIEAAPLLSDLLDAAPMLHILVTSREPLNLYEEQQYEIPPLELPTCPLKATDQQHSTDTLMQSAAIQLFIERARLVNVDFALTHDNAQAIVEICTHLEGLPLMIELVAARTPLFTPQAMVQQISNQLKLAESGWRNKHQRQQSARNLIGWSYNLLTPDEQTMFTRLAVFVGSFTILAAQAICTLPEDHVSPMAYGLETLVKKSLLRQTEETDHEPRFVMLKTIHEYALELLIQSDEYTLLRQRHATYYATLIEQSAESFWGAEQNAWLSYLDNEHDNVHETLSWFLQQGDAEKVVLICAALEPFWYWNGYQREGCRWLEQVLTCDTLSEEGRAKALDELGGLLWVQGDYQQAQHMSTQSLTLWKKLGNNEGILEALNTLGLVAEFQGDLERAITIYEEGMLLRRQSGTPRRIAIGLGNLGDAKLYLWPDKPEQAIHHFNESLEHYETSGDKRGIADMLVSLGDAALFQADYAQARQHYHKSLLLYQETHPNKKRVVRCLERLAEVVRIQGKPEQSAHLLGTAKALREQIETPLPPVYVSYNHYTTDMSRVRLGDIAFKKAWDIGQSMSLEQAMEYAIHISHPQVALHYWHMQDSHAAWVCERPTREDSPHIRSVLYSPIADTNVQCTAIIPSWHATTPAGTWIEVHLRFRIGTRWSTFYPMALWDNALDNSQRRSIAAPGDNDGIVDTDVLCIHTPANAAQARILLCADTTTTAPTFYSLTLCLTAKRQRLISAEYNTRHIAPLPTTPQLTLPPFSQYSYEHGEDWCSPTALAMVLGYWYTQTGSAPLHPFTSPDCVPTLIVPMVYDSAYGTGNWSCNTAYASTLGLRAYVTELHTLHQVARWLECGVPIICSLSWNVNELDHVPIPASNGHLLVIVGITQDGHVHVADPAGADTANVARTYDARQFTACWQRHSAGIVYLLYPPTWQTPNPGEDDAWV